MTKTDINDYSLFSTAANTANSSATSLLDNILEIHNNLMNINSSNVFVGPICNNAIENWGTINSQAKQEISKLRRVSSFLASASNSYQSTDTTVGQKIGGDHIA